VEDEVRAALADADVLSYRLLWFEPKPPIEWPVRALSAVTTHDLPTVAGLWGGADLTDQAAAGVPPDVAGARRLRGRLARFAGVPPDADLATVLQRAHASLAGARSALTLATLEDALQVAERTNLPGTTVERQNWSLALPATLESVRRSPKVARLARVMRRR
jgi:4-alpha-glucanotransferase